MLLTSPKPAGATRYSVVPPEFVNANSMSAGPRPPLLKKMLTEIRFGLAAVALSLLGLAGKPAVRLPVENPGNKNEAGLLIVAALDEGSNVDARNSIATRAGTRRLYLIQISQLTLSKLACASARTSTAL